MNLLSISERAWNSNFKEKNNCIATYFYLNEKSKIILSIFDFRKSKNYAFYLKENFGYLFISGNINLNHKNVNEWKSIFEWFLMCLSENQLKIFKPEKNILFSFFLKESVFLSKSELV